MTIWQNVPFEDEAAIKEWANKNNIKYSVIKGYENGEINETVADLTINKLEQKYRDLENKVDELNGVREDIKAFDSKNKDKEQEFKQEMQKHKVRSLYEIQKGEYR